MPVYRKSGLLQFYWKMDNRGARPGVVSGWRRLFMIMLPYNIPDNIVLF